MSRKKIKFLHTTETAAIGKSFMQNLIKNRTYFLHTSINISEILILNICNGAKEIYPKKPKKILKKDTVRISEQLSEVSVKKMSLKISRPVSLHIIKIDIK